MFIVPKFLTSHLLVEMKNYHGYIVAYFLVVLMALTKGFNHFGLHKSASLRLHKKINCSPRQLAESSGVDEVDVVVVGSGITGSTAAFYLNKYHSNTILAESSDIVGGNLVTKSEGGYLWEEGPNSFQPNIDILRLAKDVNLLDDMVLADSKLPRFVYSNENLHALPSNIDDALNFKLLSWAGKIRAAVGLLGMIQPPPLEEESVKEFVTRHLGSETFEKIIDPFISGVYAGDPARLSMSSALKKIKSLEDLGFSRGILDGAFVRMSQIVKEKKQERLNNSDLPKIPPGSLGSFKRGLQSLALQIQQILGSKVKLSHKLTKIHRLGKGFVTEFETPDGIRQYKSKYVLMTAPADICANIIEDSNILPSNDVLNVLRRVYYPPVASVSLSYPTEALKTDLNGFGHLIPRSENIRTLGTIWSSSLFKDRTPLGWSLLTSFIGGARDPLAVKMTKAAIVDQVHNDISKILKFDNQVKPKVLGVKIWAKAIPQYEKGHKEVIKSVEAIEESIPGLFLCGNYRNGVAFGDCITAGKQAAIKLANI